MASLAVLISVLITASLALITTHAQLIAANIITLESTSGAGLQLSRYYVLFKYAAEGIPDLSCVWFLWLSPSLRDATGLFSSVMSLIISDSLFNRHSLLTDRSLVG